jgi:hypothetical protein
MSDMPWEILGGIVVALVIIDFARHFYYVLTNVWAMRRAFGKPVRALPPSGVVLLNGLVSPLEDHECPIKVVLHEDGRAHRGQIYWEQTSHTVEAHPFELLLPEIGIKVLVETGTNVSLRSSSVVTDFEWNNEIEKLRSVRIAGIEEGERVIVRGVLTETREVEVVPTEYRSQKGKTNIKYVLRPLADEPLRIDAESMLGEIEELLGNRGYLLALGAIIIPYCYVRGILDVTQANAMKGFGWVVLIYGVIRLFVKFSRLDRTPWFDRHKTGKQPYRGVEDGESRGAAI